MDTTIDKKEGKHPMTNLHSGPPHSKIIIIDIRLFNAVELVNMSNPNTKLTNPSAYHCALMASVQYPT